MLVAIINFLTNFQSISVDIVNCNDDDDEQTLIKYYLLVKWKSRQTNHTIKQFWLIDNIFFSRTNSSDLIFDVFHSVHLDE